ncbi:MAG: hypothetical protein DRJ51_04910 [Thermoprotei archaeon]|nr:MAG: hypothetical protein DRJ51_04910 [Thermoprotei archaeon]RLE81170.1 MAG: hypothetical protein DRJ36_01575 [Thermoprotei archaeon]RLF02890.1 MAG: hypothetical protein DRJ59_02270 [Thermoprotei archaeon]
MSVVVLSSPSINAFQLLKAFINALHLAYGRFDVGKMSERKVSFEYGALILRTRRLITLIEKLGKKYAKVWKVLSTVSIAISFFLLFFGIYAIHLNLIKYFTKPVEFSPVMPLIPGLTFGLDAIPFFIIAVAVVMFSHELAHALVAVSEGIPIKYIGLFFFLFLFGAFIEPDEAELKKAKLLTKLRVFSAGSASNFMVYVITILALTMLFKPYGIFVEGTLEGYPAHGLLKRGDIILALNGTEVTSVTEFSRIMAKAAPGSLLKILILRERELVEFQIKLASSPYNKSRGFLGIYLTQYFAISVAPRAPWIYSISLFRALQWILLLNISVAVLNMLPIMVLDGGLTLRSILQTKLKEKTVRRIEILLSSYLILILLANIIFSLKFPISRWLP